MTTILAIVGSISIGIHLFSLGRKFGKRERDLQEFYSVTSSEVPKTEET